LAIEVDGATHEASEEMHKDSEKVDFFVSLGVRIKRYNNTDIKEDIEGVLTDLLEYIKMLETPSNSPL